MKPARLLLAAAVAAACAAPGPTALVNVLGVPLEATALEADLTLAGSPWSAPGWPAPGGGFGVDTSFVVNLPSGHGGDRLAADVRATDTAGCTLARGAATAIVDDRRVDLAVVLTPLDHPSCPSDPDAGPPLATLRIGRAGSGAGTVTVNPGRQTCDVACDLAVTPGTAVTLTIAPAVGSTFLGWSGDCEGAIGPGACSVTVSGDRAVTASLHRDAVDRVIQIGADGNQSVVGVAVAPSGELAVAINGAGPISVNGNTAGVAGHLGAFTARFSVTGNYRAGSLVAVGTDISATGIAFAGSDAVVVVGNSVIGLRPFVARVGAGAPEIYDLEVTGSALIRDLTVDADGSIAVTGAFSGTLADGTEELVSSGSSGDIFVLTLDGSVTGPPAPITGARFGGPRIDAGGVLRYAGADLLLGGTIDGSVTFGATPLTSSDPDVFVAALDPATLAPRWARVLPGAGTEDLEALAVAPDGDLLLAGTFDGTLETGADALGSLGGTDVFLVRLAPDGTPRWARRAGGPSDDYAAGVDTGPAGDVVLGGWFSGVADFGSGALVSAGGTDGFVARYAASGAPLWSWRFGGTYDDEGHRPAVTPSGIAATGRISGTAQISTQTLTANGADGVIVLLPP